MDLQRLACDYKMRKKNKGKEGYWGKPNSKSAIMTTGPLAIIVGRPHNQRLTSTGNNSGIGVLSPMKNGCALFILQQLALA